MNKRIEIVRILNNILIVYTVSSVLFLAMEMPFGTALFAGNLSLVIFVVLTELISAFCGNLIAFLGLHIASAVGLLWISEKMLDSVEISGYFVGGIHVTSIFRVLRILVMLVIMIISIYSRIDEKPRFNPGIAEGFLFIGLYVLCLIAKMKEPVVIIMIAEIIWGVLCVIYYNARQTIAALIPFKERDFVPYDSIRSVNGVMLTGSVILSMILMTACVFIDYGKEIVEFLRRGIYIFLHWLFSFLKFEEVEEYEDVKPEVTGGGFGQFLPREGPDDSLLHAIWEALFWIIAILVTILIIYLAIKLVKEFYKIFNSSRKGILDRLSRDKVEYLSPLQTSKNSFGKNSEDKLTLGKRLTAAGRVRLLFVRYIDKGYGLSRVVASDSPKQMEERIVREDKNTAMAYKLYEKARYSSQKITAEDVKEMKNICR